MKLTVLERARAIWRAPDRIHQMEAGIEKELERLERKVGEVDEAVDDIDHTLGKDYPDNTEVEAMLTVFMTDEVQPVTDRLGERLEGVEELLGVHDPYDSPYTVMERLKRLEQTLERVKIKVVSNGEV